MRENIRYLLLVGVASIAACQGEKLLSEEPAPLSHGSSGGGGGGGSSLPPALQERITQINACEDPEEGTHATFPVQRIQGEGPPLPPPLPLLYAFYNIETDGIRTTFTDEDQNNGCEPPVNDAIGTIRAVLEPKTGAVVDPNDPRSLIDIFTDVCGVAVINNESGWYEGWFVHDLKIPETSEPGCDGKVPFGHITEQDAKALAQLGPQNVPGNVFTRDGQPPHPSSGGGNSDVITTVPGNVVSVFLSLGAWNSLQGKDAHAYWELNEYTNWSFPLYELFTTGGVPGTFEAGFQYGPLGGLGPKGDSRIPSSGPNGNWKKHNTKVNGKVTFGDNPAFPRDPDRTPEACGDDSALAEPRLRFIPTGLARQVLLDAFLRPASFEPQVTDLEERLYDAYVIEVTKVDANGDGIVQFAEADIEDTSDGGQPNTRLFLKPNEYNRANITREINDGLLAPRFAPSPNAIILAANANFITPIPVTE